MMRILLTSFGPFQNFKVNPSNQVMHEIAGKIVVNSQLGDFVEFETLEVSWQGVSQFIEAKKDEKYDLIVHLGVATNESLIRIETRGQNLQSGHDIENKAPTQSEIIANASNINTTVSLEILEEFVSKNNHVFLSDNAGAYLCNYLYYLSLYFLGKKSLVLFIHIADTTNQAAAPSIEIQSNCVIELIEFIVNKQSIRAI